MQGLSLHYLAYTHTHTQNSVSWLNLDLWASTICLSFFSFSWLIVNPPHIKWFGTTNNTYIILLYWRFVDDDDDVSGAYYSKRVGKTCQITMSWCILFQRAHTIGVEFGGQVYSIIIIILIPCYVFAEFSFFNFNNM